MFRVQVLHSVLGQESCDFFSGQNKATSEISVKCRGIECCSLGVRPLQKSIRNFHAELAPRLRFARHRLRKS